MDLQKIDLRTDDEILRFIRSGDEQETEALFAAARAEREKYYKTDVYFRGLIEFTNYCKNDCYYCGIRRSNAKVERYRLSLEQILQCAGIGALLGYHTFVLQGGEDPYFTDERVVQIIATLKEKHPSCAITLSIGERSRESYAAFFHAGAERYLLRHETANDAHYAKLHPACMSPANRKRCLLALKELGYQVGAGFMVGTPYQTPENLLEDLLFLRELQPDMIGIGPFIPQADTPLGAEPGGTLEQTLRMVALARLLLPAALIPATTALGTIHPRGRELALLAGANVVMPNLSPKSVRKLYALYDNKICTGDEAAECIGCMTGRIKNTGFVPNMGRGDAYARVCQSPLSDPKARSKADYLSLF
ncbi:MAG: [FeFe] hydrogenase H-cluster radical SAM maturase HydE [Spirochaetaceae bacterium]|jgi:biotin synthase|nr:[FeFe] hydrogenase H-cluster radical SAM maturase HydE [Spirochaetaceae bacterium]